MRRPVIESKPPPPPAPIKEKKRVRKPSQQQKSGTVTEAGGHAPFFQTDASKTELAFKLIAEEGMVPRTAFVLAGFVERTYHLWMAQARKGLEPYRTLLDRIEQADARHEQKAVREVMIAARLKRSSGDMQKMLERRHRRNWGNDEDVEEVRDRLRKFYEEAVKACFGEVGLLQLLSHVTGIREQVGFETSEGEEKVG